MTRVADLRELILADPEARAEYERLGPIFAVVGEMVDARQSAGLTQAELASAWEQASLSLRDLKARDTCRLLTL